MNTALLLVDVDGVLLNKELMWQAIGERFEAQYPGKTVGELRSFYTQHRGDKPSVDNVIEIGFSTYGEDFWRPFYEVDYKSLVTPGWEILKLSCQEKGITPIVYSEGSMGRRSWMPKNAPYGFQPFKVDQMDLKVQRLIFLDKLAELPGLMEEWKREGITRVMGLDDLHRAVEAMTQVGIEAHQFCDPEVINLSNGSPSRRERYCVEAYERRHSCPQVESLHQMAAIIRAQQS